MPKRNPNYIPKRLRVPEQSSPPSPPQQLSAYPFIQYQDERIRITRQSRDEERIEFSDWLPPLALKLLEHFQERRPCRRLAEQDAFIGYKRREIGKVLQALHRVGLLQKDGHTSGSAFVTTPAGRQLWEQYRCQPSEPTFPTPRPLTGFEAFEQRLQELKRQQQRPR